MLKPEHRQILTDLSPGNLYLVGGSVRDQLMGREANDLDITVVGDACGLAKQFAGATGGECTVHERFGTATVVTNGMSIDLITARRERYPRPGVLPEVSPGTLEDDLARRDFSVNAMAISMGDGTLVDNHHGAEDLQKGVIRTLHPHSFHEDPTRILRAIRYEQRLGFTIPNLTEFQLRAAAANHALDHISGDRIRHELEKAAQERDPLPIFRRMSDLDIFRAIHRHWQPDLANVPEDWQADPVGWMVVSTWSCGPVILEEVIKRLHMPSEWSRPVRAGNEMRRGLAGLNQTSTPAEICRVLAPAEGILEGLDAGRLLPTAAEAISRYLSEWRHLRPELDGRDLIRMGMREGPELGRLMDDLKRLRLNQATATRADEEALVRRFLAGKTSE